MKPKMTLKKIARELDVSISTVSKALHDNKEINKDTREKIQAFAKFYNYRPNSIALSLKNKKTKTIGLIIPEIVHYFFTRVMSGIEEVANSKGYNLVIGVSNEAFEKEIINMDMLVNSNIDGFIMSVSKETFLKKDFHHLSEIINQGLPIVMFDRVVDEIACDKVVVDDTIGASLGTKKLIDTGCKNILLLTTEDYVNIGKLRTQGYLNTLNDNNIQVREELIVKIEVPYDTNKGQQILEELVHEALSNYPEIDGVLAVNEIYAVAALNVAQKKGFRVPEDISIVTFTDGVLSRHTPPGLTTICQHGRQMGQIAANILIDRLEDKLEEDRYTTTVVKTELIERGSTRS